MDMPPSSSTGSVLAALGAAAARGEWKTVAMVVHDAALAGVSREDIALAMDAAVRPEEISRSSAPPPQEDAALRHELGNAMTAIAALAAQAQGEGSEAAALRALARIRSVADSAMSDVGPSRGSVVLAGVRDISVDITGMVEDLAPFAEQRRVAVEARVEPGVLSRVPASTLRLVVWNLLKNAIEASPPGAGVVVTAEYREANLRVSVEDRGVGLPAALRQRAFEPHFSTKDQGRGLGLSLVQAEVRRLGGRIDVSTPPRGGARFVVTLPGASRAESMEPLGAAESSGVVRKSPLSGFRVALICDFVFLERALSAVGASVTRTSERELEAREDVFDVLVADGIEVSADAAVRLRRLGRARRVVFLAPEGTRLPLEGVDAVLARTFDLSELATTIETLLALESDVG